MERRLESGTGDARKIKAAAATLAESLPTASALGDVDALAARLAAIAEHAESAAAEEKIRREEQRAAQTARKEALAAEAEDLAANATQWKTAGDRLRIILDEWKTISGLDRKTDDALWKRYSAARRRSTGAAVRTSPISTASGPPPDRPGAAVRAGRGADRIDRLGRHQCARSAACSPSGRPPAGRPRTSTTRCGSGSRPPRTLSSRRATRSPPNATRNSTDNAAAKEALLAEAERINASDHDAARAALRSITGKWDALGKIPRDRTDLQADDCVPWRRRCATPPRPNGPTRKRRPAPSSSPSRAEQYEKQAAKAEAAGRAKEARKRPGRTPSNGGSGPTPRPAR